MEKPSVSSLEGTFLRESLGAMVDGSFEIRRSPVDIPQDPWTGVYTYMISVKHGHMKKGKWLGKYSHTMDNYFGLAPSKRWLFGISNINNQQYLSIF